jgi:hypothetical protein
MGAIFPLGKLVWNQRQFLSRSNRPVLPPPQLGAVVGGSAELHHFVANMNVRVPLGGKHFIRTEGQFDARLVIGFRAVLGCGVALSRRRLSYISQISLQRTVCNNPLSVRRFISKFNAVSTNRKVCIAMYMLVCRCLCLLPPSPSPPIWDRAHHRHIVFAKLKTQH